MNTCGTCKHFGPLVDRERDEYDVEDLGPRNETLHQCLLLKHLNAYLAWKIDSAVAGVIDGSGYVATFCVSEEFGCNQWA